jgi:uncharacterized protein YdhG (YjbR/CyaY superfamily)
MISQSPTVDAFLQSVSPEERVVFAKLRALLKKSHPKIEESMSYRMPTYQVAGAMVGAINKQKQYLCLYLNPAAVDPYRRELKALGLDCGKSCLRFTKPEQAPLELFAKIIKAAGKLAGK